MSLRERLENRPRPSLTVSLRIEDDTAARATLSVAKTPKQVAEAQAAVDACYEQLAITALPPAEWEELVAMHPPNEQQRTNDSWCNTVTFHPALLAACTNDDTTVDDWAEWTTKGALTRGEVVALINAAYEVNQRGPELHVKKD